MSQRKKRKLSSGGKAINGYLMGIAGVRPIKVKATRSKIDQCKVWVSDNMRVPGTIYDRDGRKTKGYLIIEDWIPKFTDLEGRELKAFFFNKEIDEETYHRQGENAEGTDAPLS